MSSEIESVPVKPRSRIAAAVHETAAGLHRIGLVDKATMREFDAALQMILETTNGDAGDNLGPTHGR